MLLDWPGFRFWPSLQQLNVKLIRRQIKFPSGYDWYQLYLCQIPVNILIKNRIKDFVLKYEITLWIHVRIWRQSTPNDFEMGNPNANLCRKPSAGFSKMGNSPSRPQSRYKFGRRENTVEQIKCHRPRPPQFLIMFFFVFFVACRIRKYIFYTLASFLCRAENNCYA